MNYEDIAMLVNATYYGIEAEDFNSKKDKIEKIWSKTSKEDRFSSIARAKDIENKLSYIGLKIISSKKEFEKLLTTNSELFNQKLPSLKSKRAMIKEFKSSDFPADFKDPIERLASKEHDRWAEYLTKKGWRYSPTKDKSKKLHNCLLPLSKFDTDELKLTYKYDLLAIINIPYYLSSTGFNIALDTSFL